MATLQWVPELDTGISEIDVQHRRICDYINQLDEIRHTHDRKRLGAVIEEMVDYTLSHFTFEEALMQDSGYRFSAPHKRVHELLTHKVGDFKARFDKGEDVSEELHGLLSRWLFNHIRSEDHGYVNAAKAYLRMAEAQRHHAHAPAAKAEPAKPAVPEKKKPEPEEVYIKPPALQWVAELNTGIAEIDKQHRRICDYINELADIRATHNRERLGEVIEEMVDYTLSHFAFEESLMQDSGYLFAAPHKRVHDLLTRRVADFKTRFDKGEDVAKELHGLLSRWLFNHIRNEDHGYVDSAQAYLHMTVDAQRSRLNATAEALEKPKRGWFSKLLWGGN